MDGYEDYYNNTTRELRRLRSIVREYGCFYDKIRKAYDKQNWDLV